MISTGFPLEITITAPLAERMIPANFIQFNFSLKMQEDSTVIKIGLVVTMSADRPALMNFSPWKTVIVGEDAGQAEKDHRNNLPALTRGSRLRLSERLRGESTKQWQSAKTPPKTGPGFL
jgi:hypothetical protein